MGTQRTSNKDLADKLDALIAIMTQTFDATRQAPAGVIDTTPVTDPEPVQMALPANPAPVEAAPQDKPDQAYVAHMSRKIEAMVKADGQARVLYGRRNTKGEYKLAYRLKSQWATLKDGGLIGALKVFEAQA